MSRTHLSLFSGIGGLDLAAEWAGFETVAQIEKDPFCRAVLARHWPNVPKFEDIHNVTADALRSAGIAQPPTVLSGGFPCQPFSCAGKRKGAEDDRYLWPEMLRVVQQSRPSWVVGENVAGFVGMALDDVCADLEREGYACRPLVFPAAGVGAPHKRDRVFIVAHSGGVASGSSDQAIRALGMYLAARDHALCSSLRQPPEGTDQDVADADLLHRSQCRQAGRVGRIEEPSQGDGRHHWAIEPRVGRVADGVPSRVDRLRCLGNAVVPQQAYPIFRAIAAIETGAIA